MEHSELLGMVEPLIEATGAGRIKWTPPNAEDTLHFEAIAGSIALYLGCVDYDDQRPYFLAVGRIGQPVNTMEQLRQVWDGESFEPAVLDPLWEVARKSAFGLDAVLSQLREFLLRPEDGKDKAGS